MKKKKNKTECESALQATKKTLLPLRRSQCWRRKWRFLLSEPARADATDDDEEDSHMHVQQL